ncbi:hypothetical protein CDS [Bradyrhizobium sp.]|nr:hypothetical protein CDS [Bradyrhizobium sp.]
MKLSLSLFSKTGNTSKVKPSVNVMTTTWPSPKLSEVL